MTRCFIVILIGAVAGGCAPRAGPVATVEPGSTDTVPAAVDASAGPVTAGDLYPPGPLTKMYEQTEGPGVSRGDHAAPVLEKREITSAGADGTWSIVFSKQGKASDAAPWEEVQRLILRKNAEGAVEMVEFQDRAENVLIRYEPPIVIAPATLDPGGRFVATSRAVLRALNRPDRVRDRGEVTQRVEYLGAAGDGQPGFHVRSNLTAVLSMARVVRERDLLVTPGRGGRLEHDSKVVKVGLLTWESTKRTLRWQDGRNP